jgi:diketogulonate reductase-like aldo/keto reductase
MNHIRQRAASSRKTLVGFLDTDDFKYPLDIYYIHAPTCWSGWHPRCDEISTDTLLSLREAWMAMEAIVGLDQSARRIGLSNVSPEELLDIIAFVNERIENGEYIQF